MSEGQESSSTYSKQTTPPAGNDSDSEPTVSTTPSRHRSNRYPGNASGTGIGGAGGGRVGGYPSQHLGKWLGKVLLIQQCNLHTAPDSRGVGVPVAKKDEKEKDASGGKKKEDENDPKRFWWPCLVVLPAASRDQFALPKSFRFENECVIVRSFRDSRFFLASLSDARDFRPQLAARGSVVQERAAERAMHYLETGVLPSEWDVVALLGEDFSDREQSACSCDEDEDEDEDTTPTPHALEEKDRFVALLYKYYDDRGVLTAHCPLFTYQFIVIS